MQTLKDIQLQFRDALLVNDESVFGFISSPEVKERFLIYRQTLFENLKNALQITFPGIWTLLGKECADSVAYAFIKQIQHLPNTACLDDWGFDFIDFLARVEELKTLSYLKDVAMMEWFKHLSYCASESDCLSITALQQLSEETLNQTVFHFQPSLFLYQSQYPLHAIFDVIENPNAPTVNLNAGNSYAVITRINYQVDVYWLTEAEWYFLNGLKQGQTLQQAYEANDNVDVTQMIVFMFDKGLVKRSD